MRYDEPHTNDENSNFFLRHGRTAVSVTGVVEIFFRDATRIVGGQGEGHLVVADENVRMMLMLFSKICDATDEGHRSEKIIEPKSSLEGLTALGPFGKFLKLLVDVLLIQLFHQFHSIAKTGSRS